MSEQDAEQYLHKKFPKMKPIKSPPGLGRLNGFGIGMAGKRDFDAETGTYISTRCLTALFIPFYALAAYRVAPAENGGWYFLGKEEKSTFAKVWNTMFVTGLLLFVALGIWQVQTGSDSYQAGKRLADARAHEEKGERLAAVQIYRDMLMAGLPEEVSAKAGIATNIKETMESGTPGEAVAMMEFVEALPGWFTAEGRFVNDLAEQALSASQRFTEKDPKGAYAILEAGSNFPNQPDEYHQAKRTLLERLVQDEPGEASYAIALAEAYYAEQNIEEALGLLDPLKESLGDGEGARIYGQTLVAAGRTGEAAGYLERYIAPRADTWRNAEQNYQQATEAAYQRVIDSLNNNEGPASFYQEYEQAANDQERGALVEGYAYERMQRDTAFQTATRKYEKSTAIIPVIMDLGIAQLRSGQSSADPAERKDLLAAAEKTFLSLQDSASAGGSDEFRFFLGQVYYWSGKQEEGRKLFDELLTSSGRNFHTLLTLSQTLREVGNTAESRALAEEAYQKGSDELEKGQAASQRALLATDTEDEIAWLEKIPEADASATIRLASARANKAEQEGDKAAALTHYRTAAEGWAKQPPTPSSLNNGAIVQFRLFSLTGDISHYEQGSSMMERAVSLQPDDSILVGNAASSLLSTAVMQAAEGAFHPRIVQAGIGFDSLRFLYDNQEERDALVEKLVANPNYRRGIELLEKALVLAPNSQGLHQLALGYYSFVHNPAAVKRLAAKAAEANFDTAEAREANEKYSRGENDEELRQQQSLGVKEWEEILGELNESAQQRYARVALSEIRLSLFSIGEAGDLDGEIANLRQAQAEGNSSRLHNALLDALTQKALLSLAAESPEFSGFLESGRRHLRASQLLVLALSAEGLRPVVLGNADARAALQESLEYSARFPATRSPEAWLIAQHLQPEKTDELKTAILANEAEAAAARFAVESAPWSPAAVILRHQWLVVEGKDAEAKALLEKARAEKVPLPVW